MFAGIPVRKAWALTVAAGVTLGLAVLAPHARAAKDDAPLSPPPASAPTVTSTAYQSIISTGPLTRISIGDELSCQVRFLGDTDFELFNPSGTPGSCGTFLAVSGALYTPNFKDHAGGEDNAATLSLEPYTPFTPVSQSARSGQGTTASPWQIATEVRAGATGLVLHEVDSYIARDAGYRTDVTITNQSSSTQTLVLYRAADCYLQESDEGFGFIGKGGSVACTRTPDNKPPDRVEQWVPLSSGHHFIEAYFDDVWRAIARKRSFPDTCRCGSNIDNGSGLSWYIQLSPGESARRSNILSFSAEGVVGTLRSNDTTPPQIVIGDIPASCTRSDVQLRISVFDANPVHNIRVFLDGRLIRTPRSPFFGLSIPIGSVGIGGHRVRVSAVDADGNVGVKSRVFSRCGGVVPTFVG